MASKASPRAIGGFVIGAIVLILAAIALLGSGSLFRKTFKYVTYFDGSVAGLDPGAAVKLRGVRIGQVDEVRLAVPGEARALEDFMIPVLWEVDRDLLVKHGGEGAISEALIDTLIAAGLRATLQQESFVTGKKFIGLELMPDSEIRLVGVELEGYHEIPSATTGLDLDAIQASVTELMAKLTAVDADTLIISITDAFQNLDALLSSPGLTEATRELPITLRAAQDATLAMERLFAHADSAVVPLRARLVDTAEQADEAMVALQKTLQETADLLAEEGATSTRLNEALYEVSATMRAIRSLAETLDRNPSALLRGKDYQEGEQ
ncbi:MAG: MlaD family protein [Gemmatimonadota bacterium]